MEPWPLRLVIGAGSAAIGYGILLAIGLVPATALPAAAAFAFVGLTLFVLAWQDPEWGPVGSLRPWPAPVGPARSAHPGRVRTPSRSAAAPIPARLPAAAAPLPIIVVPPILSAGDALWARLTPDTSGVLPVELVGPIAASAFEALPGESYDGPSLDEPIWDDTAASAPLWSGAPFGPDPGWTPIEHEAFNHTPPHLRPAPPAWKEIRGPHPPARSAPSGPSASSECASCHRGLTNPPAWRACTSCHRPFCGECAFRARRNLGSGRCTTCRLAGEVEEPRFVA